MQLLLKRDVFCHYQTILEDLCQYLAWYHYFYCTQCCWHNPWGPAHGFYSIHGSPSGFKITAWCVCCLFWQKSVDVQYGGLTFLHYHRWQRDDSPLPFLLCESKAHTLFLCHGKPHLDSTWHMQTYTSAMCPTRLLCYSKLPLTWVK